MHAALLDVRKFLTVIMNSCDDSSDNDMGPNLPAGVLRKRGGWEDTLGFEIQREKLREGSDEKVSAAVDLSQFRNEEVGKGYQAKHVVRQKGAEKAATGVVDMSGGTEFSKIEREGGSSLKKRSRDDDGEEDRGDRKRPPDTPPQSYLKCKGMRDFVKEIDSILQQR